MFCSLTHKTFVGAIAFFLLFIHVPVAIAGHISVSPLKVFFLDGAQTNQLTVNNSTDSAVFIEAKIKRWMQDEAGNPKLNDTDDLIFYPKISKVPAHSSIVVRLGYQKKAGDVEQTYRIFIRELPDVNEKGEMMGLGLLMRFSVPIFISSSQSSKEKVEIQSLLESDKGVLVRISNAGNHYVQLPAVHATGLRDGQSVFEKKVNGWYILHHSAKNFLLNITKDECKQADTLLISTQTSLESPALKKTFLLDKQYCQALMKQTK